MLIAGKQALSVKDQHSLANAWHTAPAEISFQAPLHRGVFRQLFHRALPIPAKDPPTIGEVRCLGLAEQGKIPGKIPDMGALGQGLAVGRIQQPG